MDYPKVINAPLYVKEPEQDFVLIPSIGLGTFLAETTPLRNYHDENDGDLDIDDASYILCKLKRDPRGYPFQQEGGSMTV
jgi:hypothetical protein